MLCYTKQECNIFSLLVLPDANNSVILFRSICHI